MCQVKIATNLPQNLAKELMTRIVSPTNLKAAFNVAQLVVKKIEDCNLAHFFKKRPK